VREIEADTLVGTRDCGRVRLAKATKGFKQREADQAEVLAALKARKFLLPIIPHVDGTPRICELERYFTTDLTLKGARRGPASL
jgi:acetoacetate decarboxylase